MPGRTQNMILDTMTEAFEGKATVKWTYDELYNALLERYPEAEVPRDSAVRQAVRTMRNARLIDSNAGPGENVKTFWSTDVLAKVEAELEEKAKEREESASIGFLDPFPEVRQPLKTTQAIRDKKAVGKASSPASESTSKQVKPPATKTVTIGENYRQGFQDGWDSAMKHLGFTVTNQPVASTPDVES